MGEAAAGKDRDVAVITAVFDDEVRLTDDILEEADAAAAEDAAVAIEQDIAAEILGRPLPFILHHPAVGRAVFVGIILQQTLSRLVANRAVERMVDEEEFEHAAAGVLDLIGLGAHHHALLDLGGAGEQELGAALHLDQTHAAAAGDGQGRVIAVMGDLDAMGESGFEDGGSRLDGDLLVVYLESGHGFNLRLGSLICCCERCAAPVRSGGRRRTTVFAGAAGNGRVWRAPRIHRGTG